MSVKFIKEVCVIFTGCLGFLVVCYGLDTLPHVPGVGRDMEKPLDSLAVGMFCPPYSTVKAGSSCSESHHAARLKSGVLC